MYIEKSLQMFSYSFSVINENNIINKRCINYTPLYIVLEMEISILLHQYYSINKRYFCLVVVLECLAAAVMWYLQYIQ